MKNLLVGIVDFRQRVLPDLKDTFEHLYKFGQKPDCLFFACSDSRVVPNLFASTHPGELFLHRNVGNLVPQSNYGVPQDPNKANPIVIYSSGAALEYGILELKVADIIVCGHSACGAMKATLANNLPGDKVPLLKHWLSLAEESRRRFLNKDFKFKMYVNGELQTITAEIDTTLPDYDQLSQINALQQIENVGSYAVVKNNAQILNIQAWWFDIRTGDIFFFSTSARRFLLIDADTAADLLEAYCDVDETNEDIKRVLRSSGHKSAQGVFETDHSGHNHLLIKEHKEFIVSSRSPKMEKKGDAPAPAKEEVKPSTSPNSKKSLEDMLSEHRSTMGVPLWVGTKPASPPLTNKH